MPPKRNAPAATPSLRLKKCCRARMPSGGGKTLRVVAIQHGDVRLRLVLENAKLRRAVCCEVRVAVEMIRRDVQQRGDMRTKRPMASS